MISYDCFRTQYVVIAIKHRDKIQKSNKDLEECFNFMIIKTIYTKHANNRNLLR